MQPRNRLRGGENALLSKQAVFVQRRKEPRFLAPANDVRKPSVGCIGN